MKVDFQLINRYLGGDEIEGDRDQIIYWFSSLEAEKDLRKHYHHYWRDFLQVQDLNGYDGSIVLGRIYREIKLEESRLLARKKPIRKIINIVTKIAAVLFIPVLVFLYVYKDNFIPSGGEVAFSEIYSPPGTRTMFYLPDGSSGWLNGGSSLEFPAEFKGKSREIMLQGEAYFEVASDRKAFVVNGPGFEVVAHGTAFNIQAYPEEKKVSVTLINGSVEVFGKRNGKVDRLGNLGSDQMCIYDVEEATYKIEPVDSRKISSWKDGKLVFRNEPFSDVVNKINRWYNVNIIIKGEKLKSHQYLATFEDETLDEVLKLLKLSAPIDYKEYGREIRNDGTFGKRKIEIYYKP